MIQAALEYFTLVFEAIGYALWLDPRAYVEVILHPEGDCALPRRLEHGAAGLWLSDSDPVPGAGDRQGAQRKDFYLVYLSGIGAISGTSIPAEEYPFI